MFIPFTQTFTPYLFCNLHYGLAATGLGQAESHAELSGTGLPFHLPLPQWGGHGALGGAQNDSPREEERPVGQPELFPGRAGSFWR